MASTRATIWAWIGHIYSLGWCHKNIAIPLESEKHITVGNPHVTGTFKVFSAKAAFEALIKRRSSNYEAIDHIYQVSKRRQSFISQATSKREKQPSDQHERLNR